MISYEYIKTRKDGKRLQFISTDNDEMLIRCVETGDVYSDVVDLEDTAYTYEEISKEEVSEENKQKSAVSDDSE